MEVPVTKQATCNHEIAQLQLSMSADGSWFDDGHIDNVQVLLSHQYLQSGGFQSACVFEPDGCQQVAKPDGHLVQILNLSGNHWATGSNINCPKDTVAVYDSMNNSPPKAGKNKLLKYLACLVVPKKTLKIELVDIQKQIDISDCGLFATAVVTSLCASISPQNRNCKQDNMQKHVLKCFQEGEMNPLPLQENRHSGGVMFIENVAVYCHCKQPYEPTRFMVECGGVLTGFSLRVRKCQKKNAG